MANVKIETSSPFGETISYEFGNLDIALRSLKGVLESGDKFNQHLLTLPGRKTFKEALDLLKRNGYTLVSDGMMYKKEDVEVETPAVKAKVIKAQPEIPMPSGNDEGWKFFASQIKPYFEAPKVDVESIVSQISEGVLRASAEYMSKEIPTQVKGEVSKLTKEVVLVFPDNTHKNVGRQHQMFETLIKMLTAQVNVLMVGPAGSGKTMGAEKAAEALGKKYFTISVGMQTTKTEFFGYNDANGRYVKTLFRDAYEHGGVFLIDEIDAGNANVITAINQAIANSKCPFPDGMVNKHENFILIASANTFGTGATREYVGRNQLDAATLDRFSILEWGYDEPFELELSSNKEWTKYVQKVRKNVEKYKIRTVVSPRASILGGRMLVAGLTKEEVKKALIFKGINETEKNKMLEGATF